MKHLPLLFTLLLSACSTVGFNVTPAVPVIEGELHLLVQQEIEKDTSSRAVFQALSDEFRTLADSGVIEPAMVQVAVQSIALPHDSAEIITASLLALYADYYREAQDSGLIVTATMQAVLRAFANGLKPSAP